ncbi:MAG: hypothetical protein AUJ01_05855 [Acidobacteria bacterium 13_1_40CM_3_65_5]|nr:MAG: hypothetical protein AUJ01_05855 [Acidobacteria bacterium 13_1_40CM_3_65_5]
MSDADLVVVGRFNSRFEADVAKSALDAAGLDSMIPSDDVAGMRPPLSLTNGVEFIVRAEDAMAARENLQQPK